MPINVRPLKPASNAEILNAIYNDASPDYQRRIPHATDASVQETLGKLQQYRPLWNEFLDALINRIGSVVVRNKVWSNPLAMFKRGMLSYGSIIEEIGIGLLQAHVYDPDREYMEKDLFGTERPWVESNFHQVNRENFYKITINEQLLRRAFLESDGLGNFVSALMTAPTTSDQWDEFLLTTSLFQTYESADGFYHVNVPDVAALNSGEADAKVALRKMRAMAGNLEFMSTKYNAARLPTFAQRDDLILLASPEFSAAIDVEALAGAFNIERSQVHGRIVNIPAEYFGIDGVQAIMTVPDFFVIADVILENTSQYNPVALHNNYFLHHHEIVSASRFVPAVAFWTGADDEVVVVAGTITGITPITDESTGARPTTVPVGGIMALQAAGTGTSGETGVIWAIAGNASNRTRITQHGTLHIGFDETVDEIVVTASTAWVNPANTAAAPFTSSVTIEVEYPTEPDVEP